jgi:predicted nucleic acid-binding protein
VRFWDASALAPLLLTESRTTELQALARADERFVVWWGTVVECASALARQHRRQSLSEDEHAKALEALALTSRAWRPVIPSDDVRYDAMRFVRVHPLSAADAFQLAAALHWAQQRPGGLDFVCLDARLRQAAAIEGFTVLPANG